MQKSWWAGAASGAIGVGTRKAHGAHHQIARAQVFDTRAGLDHFAQRFVAQHKAVPTRRRRAVSERADVFVGSAYAHLDHAQLDLRGRGDARLGDVDDIYGLPGRIHGDGFHGCSCIVSNRLAGRRADEHLGAVDAQPSNGTTVSTSQARGLRSMAWCMHLRMAHRPRA